MTDAAKGVGGSSPVAVTSEVGRLRRVLVHEPGREVDLMVPEMMEELLFDDILHGRFARDEHRRFRRVLQLLGVEVLESLNLLTRVLEGDEGRRWVEERVLSNLRPEFEERVREMPPSEMAQALIGGVRRFRSDSAATPQELFEVRPLPNWCFQRDTQVVVGGGVIFSSMATAARRREALLSRAIFRFHPDLAPIPILSGVPGSEEEGEDASPERGFLEGGDVLILSPDVVVVGHSERTSEEGILELARALGRLDGGPRWLIRVELPQKRAFMHLDTLFTPVDRDACLVFAPVILSGGSETAATGEYDLTSPELEPRDGGDLLSALKRRGVDYEPIPCGGQDPMDQLREQWTDGANALAVAPGVAVLYDRNVRTAEEMERRGFRVVRADDLLLGSSEVDLAAGERVCILTRSNELSRARGGPHCLTHPLLRDAL
jgi:arginine deiminase